MIKADLYTKKRIVDLRQEDDTFDVEYFRRLSSIKTKTDLICLLVDYEEFLPQGLQRLRDIGDNEFILIIEEINRFVTCARNNQPLPVEPTEITMLAMPPMIVLPRQFALAFRQETGQTRTFGKSFHYLASCGHIKKIMQSQEIMYKRVIEIQDDVRKTFDTKS